MRLTPAQTRVMKWLSGGWTTEPGSGMSIHINGKRVCNVDTLYALKKHGLVEQHSRWSWRATEAGKLWRNHEPPTRAQ